jgi:hypothetical protein
MPMDVTSLLCLLKAMDTDLEDAAGIAVEAIRLLRYWQQDDPLLLDWRLHAVIEKLEHIEKLAEQRRLPFDL